MRDIDKALAAIGEAMSSVQALLDAFPNEDRSSWRRDVVRAQWKLEDAQRLLRGGDGA